jgi:hypothetical protein
MTSLLLEPDHAPDTERPTAAPAAPPAPAGAPVPAPARSRGRRPLRLAAALLGLALVVPLGQRALDALPSLGNPFAERTVDRSSAPLMTALADLSEYHAATGTFQVVVDLEQDTRFVPAALSGERTTFLATGEVDALVDFTDVAAGTVVSDDRRTVSISLPAPRLDDVRVDPAASRVVARDRGLLQRVSSVFEDNPTSERQLYLVAERKIGAAAGSSDLARRAEQNTRQMLTAMAEALGYTQVTVTFATS